MRIISFRIFPQRLAEFSHFARGLHLLGHARSVNKVKESTQRRANILFRSSLSLLEFADCGVHAAFGPWRLFTDEHARADREVRARAKEATVMPVVSYAQEGEAA
jgi:hypothetical protein